MTARWPSASRIDDPLAGLMRATHRDRAWLTGALAVAAHLHGLLAWRVSCLGSRSAPTMIDVPTEMVEIEVPQAEPPAPVEAPKAEAPLAPTLPAPAHPEPRRRTPLLRPRRPRRPPW